MRVFGAVAVVMVLAGGLVVALKEQPSSTAAHGHQRPPVTSVPATTAPDQPFPSKPEELPAGSYQPKVFKSDLTMQLDAGWSFVEERADSLEFGRADPNLQGAGLDFYLVDRVVNPTSTPASGPLTNALQPLPSRLLDWMSRNNRVNVESSGVYQAGIAGTSVQFEVAHGYPYTKVSNADVCSTGIGCVALFRMIGSNEPKPPYQLTQRVVATYAGYTSRCYFFETPERALVVVEGAPSGPKFDAFDAAVNRLMAGLVITAV
jgi:hypothetical protein